MNSFVIFSINDPIGFGIVPGSIGLHVCEYGFVGLSLGVSLNSKLEGI